MYELDAEEAPSSKGPVDAQEHQSGDPFDLPPATPPKKDGRPELTETPEKHLDPKKRSKRKRRRAKDKSAQLETAERPVAVDQARAVSFGQPKKPDSKLKAVKKKKAAKADGSDEALRRVLRDPDQANPDDDLAVDDEACEECNFAW